MAGALGFELAHVEWVKALPFGAGSSWTYFQYAPGTLSSFVTDSPCYDMAAPFLVSDDNWLFYGGKGKGTGCNY